MADYTRNIVDVLNWVKDVEEGDFISSPGYSEDYFGFPCISEIELCILVDIVNSLLILDESDIRVVWVAGEVRPVDDPEKIYLIDEEIKNDMESHLFIELAMEMR